MKGASALRRPTQTARLDTSGTNITTSAYVTFLAAASNLYGTSGVEIFNPTGSTILIATGTAGSEILIPYSILPGGSSIMLPIEIQKGARIAMKAVDVTASSGLIVLNFFG